MQRSESRSFITPNPDGVTETLQVRANVVSGNSQDARNILSDDPTRSNFGDQARKFRPQIPLVILPFPLTSHGEGLLAWKSSVDDVDCFPAVPMPYHLLPSEVKNVLIDRHARPMFP
jgi:hypothetical protein